MYHIKKFEKHMQREVMEFYKKCLPQSGRCFQPEGVHRYLTEIEKNFEFFLCLFDELDLIGTIAIRRMDKDKCELKAFYLLNDYHGKGLGMKLMQDAIDYAKKSGFREMYLDTITSKSLRAIRLYRRCGFIDTEKYNNAIEADLFMKLIL